MNAKVEVRFTNITLSLDHKLLSGIIETTYDPNESGIADIDEYIDIFTEGYGVGAMVTGQVTADTTVGYPILWPGGIVATLPSGYNQQTGMPAPGTTISITITNALTNAQTTIQVDQLPTTIMDANGNVYQVATNGGVSLVAQSGGAELLQNMNKKVIDGDKALVIFGQTETAKYAFDKWQPIYKKSNKFNKEYEKIVCVNGGLSIDAGNYYVSAKAIAPGAMDTLIAVVRKPAGSTISKDSVQFVNSKGTKYTKIVINDSTLAIPIVGGPEKDAQEIYAVYKQTNAKTLNFGKLLVASYPAKQKKVKLIPMPNVSYNFSTIKSTVEGIYKKININLTIEEDATFSYNDWDQTNNGMQVNGTGLLTQMTDEMKNLVTGYKNQRDINDDTYYMFMLPLAESSEVKGTMPRGKQFGYIFTNNNTQIPRTVAHELGHGILTLEHTFDYNGLSSGMLDSNLMDYTNGIQFAKCQWDIAHDPALVIGALDSDEDAFSTEQTKAFEGEFGVNGINIAKSAILACLPAGQKWINVQLTNNFVVKLMLDDIKDFRFKDNKLQGIIKNDNKFYSVSGFKVKKSFERDGVTYIEQRSESQEMTCWDCVRQDNLISRTTMLDINDGNKPVTIYNDIPQTYKHYTEVIGKDCNTAITVYYIDNNGACNTRIISTEECKDNSLICGSIDYKEFDEFVKKLDQYTFIGDSAYRRLQQINTCILKNLSLGSRVNLYTLLFDNAEVAHPLSQDEGGYIDSRCNNGKDFLLVEMLKTASDNEIEWLLKPTGFFFANNGTNTNFIRFMNHNKNFEMKLRFAVELTRILVEKKNLIRFTPVAQQVTLSDGTNITIPNSANPVFIYFENWFQASNSFVLNGHTVTFDESGIISKPDSWLIDISQKYSLKNNTTQKIFDVDETYSVHPFEFVKLYLAKDMTKELGLKEGDSVITTAFMAAIINQVGQQIKDNANFKIGATLFAIAAAAFTGGTSLSALAAGESLTFLGGLQLASNALVLTTSLANLNVMSGLNNNTLSPQQMQQLANWEKFYSTVLIIDAGLNFISVMKAVAAETQLPALFQNMAANNLSKLFGPASKVKMTPVPGAGPGSSTFSLTTTEGAYSYITKASGQVSNPSAQAKILEFSSTPKNYPAAFDGTGALKIERATVPYQEISPLTVVVEKPSGVVAQMKYYAPSPIAQSMSIAELVYLYEPNQTPQLVYATEAALDDLEDKQNGNNCTTCTRFCQRFKTLLLKYPAHTPVINKICQQADGMLLNGILDKLFSLTFKTNEFLTDLGQLSGEPEHINNRINKLSARKMDAWQYLYNNQEDQAPFARKHNLCLDAIAGLENAPRKQAVIFSDKTSTSESTLVAYCLDLINTNGFITFLNKPANLKYAKGFVGHKQNPIYEDQQYEELTDDEVLRPATNTNTVLLDKIKERIRYSETTAQRLNNFAKGREFEETVKALLVQRSGILWDEIKSLVPDLDSRRILSQVYFCLPNNSIPCSGEGQYFIADFVLLKYDLNPAGQPILTDMIVIDSKLSGSTRLTDNQNMAVAGVGRVLPLRISRSTDINLIALPGTPSPISAGTEIKLTKFIVVHSSNGVSNVYNPGGVKLIRTE
jgi:hypothetical protein